MEVKQNKINEVIVMTYDLQFSFFLKTNLTYLKWTKLIFLGQTQTVETTLCYLF